MKIINKLIFLDIDGVLNHTSWFKWAVKHPEFLKEGGDRNIDPNSVKKIIEICDKTNAGIVLSSSWRLWEFEQTIKNLSSKRDLIPILDRMIGITPRTEDGFRGQEIKYFLNECRKNHFNTNAEHKSSLIKSNIKIIQFPKYIILDDDSDMLEEQEKFFIHINDEIGITDKDIEIVIKLLNER